MENILVGLIVVAALVFSLRSFVRTYRGKGSCGCGDGCACGPSQKECCGQQQGPFQKRP